jgi:hypothetical protein
MNRILTRTLLIGSMAAGGAWAADTAPKATEPNLPPGATAKVLNDQKDELGVLAKATNAAMTKNGLDNFVARLATPDYKRMKDFANKQDVSEINGRIDQINKNWKTKYGDEFDASKAIYDGFAMVKEGEISNPGEFQKNWPVPTSPVMTADGAKTVAANTADTDKYLDQGRNVAVVNFPASHNLPAFTISMVHEAVDDWRIDVPDDVTGQQVYNNLKTALTSFGDNVAAWPADKTEAYRDLGHRVLMSAYGMNANEARTASEKMGPTGK